MTNKRAQGGFSLIELMVALVAGLIVVGAVLAFTMSSLNTNTSYIQSTRLTQELRNVIDFTSRELRRAGYDEGAINYYSQSSGVVTLATSPFGPINLVRENADDSCVLYAYDRGAPAAPPGGISLGDGELRGIRRVVRNGVGIVEVAESAAGVTPDCGGNSPDYTASYPAGCSSNGWCPLSDPRVLNVTQFNIDETPLGQDAPVGGGTPIRIRDLHIRVAGSLIAEPNVQRQVRTRVRVRADCLRTQAACNATPT